MSRSRFARPGEVGEQRPGSGGSGAGAVVLDRDQVEADLVNACSYGPLGIPRVREHEDAGVDGQRYGARAR